MQDPQASEEVAEDRQVASSVVRCQDAAGGVLELVDQEPAEVDPGTAGRKVKMSQEQELRPEGEEKPEEKRNNLECGGALEDDGDASCPR